jgi:hypothetical protein
MFKVAYETAIRACPEVVYDILTDFGNYARWNPWNVRADAGRVAEGQTVSVTVKMGRCQMTVKHKILAMKPNVELVWCDLGWFTRFAYGERACYLQPVGQTVKYRVELMVTGPLAWLAKRRFGRAIQRGVQAETDALKRLAETRTRMS